MNYDALRSAVLDGDLIAVRATRSLLAKATVLVTRSPYTHTAIALWLGGGLWIAEMNAAGNVLVPLSQYADTLFDVYRCPVDRVRVRTVLLEQLREHTPYGWPDVAYIGLHRLAGVPLPPLDEREQVCSSYSLTAYLRAGLSAALPIGVAVPSIAAPADVVRLVQAVVGPASLTNAP